MYLIDQKTKKNSGFSMVELVITIAITGVIAVGTSSLWRQFLGSRNTIITGIENREKIQATFDKFTIEARSAKQSALGGFPVESASTSSFVFFSDIYKNGTIERVRYFLVGNKFNRGVLIPSGNPLTYDVTKETTSTLISTVSTTPAGIFSYYALGSDATSSPLSSPIDVSKISVVQLNISYFPNAGISATSTKKSLTTSVAPRNLLHQ